jgi:hypothetical protein
VTRDQAIAVAQNYARHAKLYAPEVQRAGMRSFLGLSRSVPPGFDQESQKQLRAFVDN